MWLAQLLRGALIAQLGGILLEKLHRSAPAAPQVVLQNCRHACGFSFALLQDTISLQLANCGVNLADRCSCYDSGFDNEVNEVAWQGYYQPDAEQTACIRCPIGRVSSVEGSTACKRCSNETNPHGGKREYSNSHRNRCVRCEPLEWDTARNAGEEVYCPHQHL